MINFYHHIATRLSAFRWPLALLCLASIGFSVFLLLSDNNLAEHYLLPVAVLSIWLLLILALSYFFTHPPQRPTAQSGFFTRLGYRLKRLGNMLLALIFTLATLALIVLSIKALALMP